MTEGQRLVAFYVDECLEQGAPEMICMKGHVARRIKEIFDVIKEHPEAARGREPEAIAEDALREFVRRRSRTPLALNDIVVEQGMNDSDVVAARPEVRKRASEWIEANGWPTGARFVRGTHSGSYVYDPLGLEKPMESDWPYRKPSFDDICEALAAKP
jgi:hypothetical protein